MANEESSGTPKVARQWLLAQPFAHRGLHNLKRGIPENSLKAFSKAIEKGVGIELDARVASDGVAVVFHDATLERLSDGQGVLADLPSFEITKHRILNTDQHIPTLRDVLDFIRGRVPVLIEIKSETPIRRRIISAVRHALEGYRGQVGVMSFDPEVPRWFSEQNLPWNYGLVLTKHSKTLGGLVTRMPVGQQLTAKRSKAQFFAVDVRDLPCRFIKKMRKDGFVTLCWTVKSEADFDRARSNVDNVIFEKFNG
ncbi:MAG: glycerophosphodiester phosphodiesterase family protein [Sphingomonadales bacterium]|jgi:glycerophosphoryl diester phosphodiesterase